MRAAFILFFHICLLCLSFTAKAREDSSHSHVVAIDGDRMAAADPRPHAGAGTVAAWRNEDVFSSPPPAQDSMVRPLRPLKVRIRPGAAGAVKKLRVMVRNNDADAESMQTLQLAATNIDCPASTIQSGVDFEPSTPGQQDTITLRGRQTKTAIVLLQLAAADFTTVKRDAPARCTLVFAVESTAPGNIDPSPANNSMPVEINVFDGNDAAQPGVHETVLESVRVLHPGKVEIPPGVNVKDTLVRIAVINADTNENPGDVITVTVDDGDCPSGTVGAADFDKGTAGQQSSVTVNGGAKVKGSVPLRIDGAFFDTVQARSPARCIASLTAVGPGGDLDLSNNTSRLVIDVIDHSDF